MTLNLDPSVTVTVADTVENLEGPIIIGLEDFTLIISEQQAADLSDQLSANLHARTDQWEVTDAGKAALEQLARN